VSRMADDPHIIDFIARDKDGGVILILVEGREFDGSTERVVELQTKIAAYAEYVTDGGLVRDHPDLAGKPVRVELRCVHAPDPVTAHVLTAVQSVLLEHGVPMAVKQVRRRADS